MVVGLIIDNLVWIALANNLFWLGIALALTYLAAHVFRTEISGLLSSLGSFSVAGTHFELRDKNLALKSYAILSNIFLDLLSDSAKRETLVAVFSEVNAQQLSTFTLKYLVEAKTDINYPLVRNIAYIAGKRAGNAQDTLALYDALIKSSPNDLFLRHEKALFMMDLNPARAREIYGELIAENPGYQVGRYNYAICSLLIDEFDDALKQLKELFEDGFDLDPEMDQRAAIRALVRSRPQDAEQLFHLHVNPDLRQRLLALLTPLDDETPAPAGTDNSARL